MANNSAWDNVEEKIEQSKIKRYPWKKLLNMALTEYVNRLCMSGETDVNNIILILNRHPRIAEFILANPAEAEKIKENLKILYKLLY